MPRPHLHSTVLVVLESDCSSACLQLLLFRSWPQYIANMRVFLDVHSSDLVE